MSVQGMGFARNSNYAISVSIKLYKTFKRYKKIIEEIQNFSFRFIFINSVQQSLECVLHRVNNLLRMLSRSALYNYISKY